MTMENLPGQVKNSLRYSIYDGIFYFLMVGAGESFFIPFALFLNASTVEVGLLGTLPLLLGSLAQLGSSRISGWVHSRKAFVRFGARAQAYLFLPMALLIVLPGAGGMEIFLLLVCLYSIAGLIIVPAWSSWMGDLVPENSRGQYFGKRNRITGLFTLVSLILAGTVLVMLQKHPQWEAAGFGFLFVCAFGFRLGSVYFLGRKWEPATLDVPEEKVRVRSIMREPRFAAFRKLCLFLVLMNFAVFMAAPYFIPYMLDTLKMDYFSFTLVQGAIILSKYLAMPLWGKWSDHYGSRKVLVICGLIMPGIPLLWLFHDGLSYLIIVQVLSGFVWAGFELASFNIVLDHTPPIARVSGVAYLNALNGVAVFGGALLGAQIVEWGPFFSVPYFSVFVASFLARYAVVALLSFKLKETREVAPLSVRNLLFRPFSNLSIRGLYQTLPRFKKREP